MNSADDVTLIRILRAIGARWRLVVAMVVSCTTLGLIAAFLMTPTYRAEILLSFNKDLMSGTDVSSLVSQFGGLSSIAGLSVGGSEGEKDEALALLKSRSFLESFIQDLDLMPVLFANRWSAKDKTWVASRWSSDPTEADGVKHFNEQILAVSEDRRTGLIRLSVEWKDRETAALWANELVRRINELTRALAISEARESQRYLHEELAKTNVVELRHSIYGLVEQELQREMIASVRAQYSFRVIDPAKPPDADDFVKPRRLLLVLFGLSCGLLLGFFAALLLNALSGPPPARS